MNAIHARSQLRYWPTREVEPTIITGPPFTAAASRHLAVIDADWSMTGRFWP
jgi:hypothetical protein